MNCKQQQLQQYTTGLFDGFMISSEICFYHQFFFSDGRFMTVSFATCSRLQLPSSWLHTIDVGAQSTLGGTTFLPKKYVQKNNKLPEFYMIFLPEKVSKDPNFYDICPKN